MMYRFLLVATIVLFASCGGGKKGPDVSGVKVDVTIERFEPAFFRMDTVQVAHGLGELRNAFPAFYPVFLQNILQVSPMDTASFAVIRSVVRSYLPFYDSIQKKYPSMDWLEAELKTGFQHVKYYYPQYRLPKVITFIGTLDAPGAVVTPDYLALGLQQAAGKNFSAYGDPEVQQLYPAYISRRFDKEYLAVNGLKAIADDIYPDQSTARPLIEQMVEKGKQWYLVDHFLPDTPDSVKTGYTQKQLDWVTENEGNVWSYIIKNENPYSIEPNVVQTYIGESPFTQGMPESSPGNIGQWIGWQIVKKFATQNPKLSLPEVLATPARTVFEGSSYKPK